MVIAVETTKAFLDLGLSETMGGDERDGERQKHQEEEWTEGALWGETTQLRVFNYLFLFSTPVKI